MVTCQCGRRFRAKDEDAGKRAKCPDCGARFRIPEQTPELTGTGSVYGNIKPKHCLTVVKGPERLREHFRLRRSRVMTIGKAPDNAVSLRDARVSRHHCRISWTDRGWLLEDLKSTNGTFVNGQKTDKQVLSGGDHIEIGSFELEFEAPAQERIQPARFEEQLEALKSEDPESRKSAMEFLAGSGSRAADQLVPKLSGYDTMTGHLAMEVLERLGPEAVASLVHSLKGRDKAARSSAARALGKLGPQAVAAVPDLLEALNDQDPTVYAEVASALGRIGPAAVPGLVSALRSAERAKQLSGAWALGRIGPDAADAIPVLSELAKDHDKELRQVALSALKKISPTQQISN